MAINVKTTDTGQQVVVGADGSTLSTLTQRFGHTVNLVDDFNSNVSSCMTYCTNNRPLTLYIPKGTYDFTGQTIPAGIAMIGQGYWYNVAGNPVGGYSGSTIIQGGPTQGGGPAGGYFSGLVFDGGLTVVKQHTTVDRCGFTGSAGLIMSAGAPYSTTVSNCSFRQVNNTCLRLVEGANSINIHGNYFQIYTNQRGIEAEVAGNPPIAINIMGNAFDVGGGTTTIGSMLYGEFWNCVFMGNYMEPNLTCNDGAQIVLASSARYNNFWLPDVFSNTYAINGSLANTFHASGRQIVTGSVIDLDNYSAVPDEIICISGASSITLPPITERDGQPGFTIRCNRVGGTTVNRDGSSTINGSTSLAMANGESWQFYTIYVGTTPTDWQAVRVA